MEKKVSISHMSNAHTDWLRGLDFYKDEIKILRDRLTEVAGKNTNREAMKEIEHFENQFNVQTENIHKLVHDIQHNIKVAGREAHNSGAGYIDGALLAEHNLLGDRFQTEEKTVNELRQSFNRFASVYM